VALSTSGRDRGRTYAIIKVLSERLVALVDGENRKIDNPKIKNLKHLKVSNRSVDEIKTALERGEIPEDQLIKGILKRIYEARECDGKEVW
jgi:ribosomal protein L14E/L6E/L27E